MSGVDLIEQGINVKNLHNLEANFSSDPSLSELENKIKPSNMVNLAIAFPQIKEFSNVKSTAENIFNLIKKTESEYYDDLDLNNKHGTTLEQLFNLKILDNDKFNELNLQNSVLRYSFDDIMKKILEKESADFTDIDNLFKMRLVFPELVENSSINQVINKFDINKYINNFKNIEKKSHLKTSRINLLMSIETSLYKIKILNSEYFKNLKLNEYTLNKINEHNLLKDDATEYNALAIKKILKSDIVKISSDNQIIIKDHMSINDQINLPTERSFA